MDRNPPVRKSQASTGDLLTWSEEPLPAVDQPTPPPRRTLEPAGGISPVMFGAQMSAEEAESLSKRKPCSSSKLREMTGSGIFVADGENEMTESGDAASNSNNKSIRIQQAVSAISQISFGAEETVSPKKPTSIAEVAKRRELSGTAESELDAQGKKQLSQAKSKELSGHDIFGPPPDVPVGPLAARNLELRGTLDFVLPQPQSIHTLAKVTKLSEETFNKTRMIHTQKFQELTGNDIFKEGAPPGSAEKSLSMAKLREMSGSDIFADGKAASRDYFGGVRKPPGDFRSLGGQRLQPRKQGERLPPRSKFPSVAGNSTSMDPKRIVEILAANTETIKRIRVAYRALYNHELLHVLARGHDSFSRAAYLRASEDSERDAEIIRAALFGSNADLNTIVEILCTRSTPELKSCQQAYQIKYNSILEKDVSNKTKGSMKEILMGVLRTKKEEGADTSLAICDAKVLYEAIESGRYIDQKNIILVLANISRCQMKTTFSSFKQLYGHEFRKILKKNKCGEFGENLRMVVRCIQSPEKHFAKHLQRRLMVGDVQALLIITVVSRFNIDIKSINSVFTTKTGWTLESLIRNEFCSSSSRDSDH